jgi:integrase
VKAKFALLAAVKRKRITIPLRKGAVPPVGATRFYVRYTDETGKRHDDPIGPDFEYAVAAIRSLQEGRIFELGEAFKLGSEAEPKSEGNLHSRIETYLAEIRANRAKETWRGYREALQWFDNFLPKRTTESIVRIDLLNFKNFLVEQGYSPATVFNAFVRVKIFLKKVGVLIRLERDDWPRFVPRDPEAYTPQQLNAMFAVATPEEALFLKSLLFSGMRRGELKHLTYGDIDFRRSVWKVRPKNGWKPKKTSSERSILILPSLTKQLEEQMRKNNATEADYVFANRYGNANGSLLCILKDVATRAGIKGRVDLHKFRSTYATLQLRKGVDVRQVAKRLGHSNLKTILQYVEVMDLESPQAMAQAVDTFGEYDKEAGA